MSELPEEVKIFVVEGYENVDSVEQNLLKLERNPDAEELIHGVFRSIHTIKGNSGFLGFSSLEVVCHRAEALLDRVKQKKLPLDAPMVSVLLSSVDVIRTLLQQIEAQGSDEGIDVQTTAHALDKVLEGR